MKNRYNSMKKSKYDILDVTNRLYDLNFEKYKQLHYGNMEINDDPFHLGSLNRNYFFNPLNNNGLNNNQFNDPNRLHNSNYGSKRTINRSRSKSNNSNSKSNFEPLDNKRSDNKLLDNGGIEDDPFGIRQKLSTLTNQPNKNPLDLNTESLNQINLDLRNSTKQILDSNTVPNISSMNQLLQMHKGLKTMGFKINIPEVPTIESLLGINDVKKEKDKDKEKKLNKADIAILEKFKNLMQYVINNKSELSMLINLVTSLRSYYNGVDFLDIVTRFIRAYEAFDKKTIETTKEYNTLIDSINIEKKINLDKIKKVEEKLVSLVTDYENIKYIYSNLFDSLEQKFEVVRRYVQQYRVLYEETRQRINHFIRHIGAIGGDDAILLRRLNYELDNGNRYDYNGLYTVMDNLIRTHAISFNNKMLISMASAVRYIERPEFVRNETDNINNLNPILLADSYGNLKAQLIMDGAPDLYEMIIRSLNNHDISNKTIFDIGVFERWIIVLDLNIIDIRNSINNSITQITNLYDNIITPHDRFRTIYPNIINFINHLNDHANNFDSTNPANNFVELLILTTYNGCLGDMMILSTYILILNFFNSIYTISPFLINVANVNEYLRYKVLNSTNNAVFQNINGNDYNNLKDDIVFQDYTVVDFIILVLFFKFKLMIINRDLLNGLSLNNINDRTNIINTYNIVGHKDYNVHNFNDLVFREFDDFRTLLDDVNHIQFNNTGLNVLDSFYQSLTAHVYLLEGFMQLELNMDGSRGKSIEYAQFRDPRNILTDTLLSNAIQETYARRVLYGDGIHYYMVALGLEQIFINMQNNERKNILNMIFKTCAINNFLVIAGTLPAGNIHFYDLLNDNIFAVLNNNYLNGTSQEDKNENIANIIREIYRNLSPDEKTGIIVYLNQTDETVTYTGAVAGDPVYDLLNLTKTKLGDIMILFIYNMILHLVMLYYSSQSITVSDEYNGTASTADIDIKIANGLYTNVNNNTIDTILVFEQIITDFYMLLARFMCERVRANNCRTQVDRNSIIIGYNGTTNFYDHTAVLSINFLLTDNPDSTNPFPGYDNPCIANYLEKLHIRYNPQLHGGGGDSPNITAINEFYIACCQTGALLTGYLNINDTELTYP